MRIGITGSLSSGKSTVTEIISKKQRPFFSADQVVSTLYKSRLFQKKIRKKFNLKSKNIKIEIRNKIFKNEIKLKKLGKFVHPFVRQEMKIFTNRYKKKDKLFYEIPLLIESNLMSFFDFIILVVSKKKLRLKRYLKRGGDRKLFLVLDKNQISERKKIKYSDILVVNNKSKKALKTKVNDIIL